MFTFGNDVIQRNEIPTDFEKLGVVNMTKMGGSMPFFSFIHHYAKHGTIMREDEEKCNGSCFDYLKKHLKFDIAVTNQLTPEKDKSTYGDPRICTAEDIT